VLALKLARPGRFDGVALVVGSAAPDAAYAVAGLGVDIPSHAWHALFWFCVPMTWLVAMLIRRAAPYVAAHLPDAGWFAVRDYGVLATVRHPLVVTLYSAFLGALTHQLWDAVTHPYVLFLGTDTRLPGMHATAIAGLRWWRVIHFASELVGATSTAIFAVHVGRRHLLHKWHGPAPIVPRRPGVFWAVAAGLGLVVAAIGAVLPHNDLVNVAGVRVIVAVAVAMLGAAGVVAIVSRNRQGGCGGFG